MATISDQPADPLLIFLRAIKTESTKKMYRYSLEKYADYCRVEDYPELLQGDNPAIEARVMQYIEHLNNDRFSNSMRNIQTSAIKLFYVMNDKVLNWDKMLRLKRVDDNPRNDRAYSKDEITAMVKATDDPRAKAIILIYATSGIRKDALPGMRLTDLQYYETEKTLSMKVYPGNSAQYLAFLTPQATTYLKRYLKTRFKTLDNLPKDAYLITHNVYQDQPVSVDSIERTVKEMAVRVGIRPEDHDQRKRKDVMLLHGFRKFFNSTLVSIDGFNLLYKEELMGHDVGLDNHYLRPTAKQLLAEYSKARQALTFDLAPL